MSIKMHVDISKENHCPICGYRFRDCHTLITLKGVDGSEVKVHEPCKIILDKFIDAVEDFWYDEELDEYDE